MMMSFASNINSLLHPSPGKIFTLICCLLLFGFFLFQKYNLSVNRLDPDQA